MSNVIQFPKQGEKIALYTRSFVGAPIPAGLLYCLEFFDRIKYSGKRINSRPNSSRYTIIRAYNTPNFVVPG